MLSIEKIDSFDQFLLLKEDWNKLLNESDSNTLFLTHEWLSVWWKNLGKGKNLFILCVKENGRILALAPFMSSKGTLMKLPVKKIEFIGAGWGYGGIILTTKKKECSKVIWEYIRKFGQEGILVLSKFSNNQETLDILINTLKDSPFLYLTENRLVPYIPLSGSWDEYLSLRSSNFRRNIKKRKRYLQKVGHVSFERYNSPIDMDISEIMTMIFEVSQKSWKAKPGTAIASNHSVKNFYLDLANIFYEKKWLDIVLLKINSQPIAYQLGICYQRKYFAIDTAFDLKYAFTSPGNQLCLFLLKNLFQENLTEFDYLVSFDYKKKFTAFERQYTDVFIFKKEIYPLFLFLLRSKIIPLLKNIV